MPQRAPTSSAGYHALRALECLKPKFHPDPTFFVGALEHQFIAGPREVPGSGRVSYSISNRVLHFISELAASNWTSIESGCGYSTVVLASSFETHICVNPDLASNQLVREFVERHVGISDLRFVELSSDLGLPTLVAKTQRVDLALIDGNHSHPYPVLDFHYMDLMLRTDGRLLIDDVQLEPVRKLIGYLDVECAYELEQFIDNCAVYRKVQERTFGWKTQVLPTV